MSENSSYGKTLPYIPLYLSYLDTFDCLTDAEFGDVLRCAMSYARTGEREEREGGSRIALSVLTNDIRYYQKKYNERSAKCARSARKRWNKEDPCDGMPSQQGEGEGKGEGEKEGEREGEGHPAAQRDGTPTYAAIAAYIHERGDAIDAGRFYDYYMARGWQTGTGAVKDWKALVRTWEQTQRMIAPEARQDSSDPRIAALERMKEGMNND